MNRISTCALNMSRTITKLKCNHNFCKYMGFNIIDGCSLKVKRAPTFNIGLRSSGASLMCKVWKSFMSICNLANDQMLFIHAQREFVIDSSLHTERERDRHAVCVNHRNITDEHEIYEQVSFSFSIWDLHEHKKGDRWKKETLEFVHILCTFVIRPHYGKAGEQ